VLPVSGEDHAIHKAHPLRRLFGDRSPVGPTSHHQEPRPAVAAQQLSRRLQQEIEAAVSLDPGDDPDHAVLRREAEARADLRIRRLRGEALGVHGSQDAAHRPAAANRPVAPRRLR
jgi:hypothetical protein